MQTNEIVGACLSQFYGDQNSFELLLAYADGREIGHLVSRTTGLRIAEEFALEFLTAALSDQERAVEVKAMPDQRALFETAVVDRLKESGFLEIEIRTECLVRSGDDYENAVINAGWHYWNAALSANPSTSSIMTGWQTMETAPHDQTIIVWWPIVALDEDGDPTDTVEDGCAVVTEWNGGYWLEPDVLNAIGDHMGDDCTYADKPSHWMPLPAPLFVAPENQP